MSRSLIVLPAAMQGLVCLPLLVTRVSDQLQLTPRALARSLARSFIRGA